ncbi:hypothetical protein M422DRAFT_187082, partial [Sphaerobolus stellatus SS14]
FLEDHTHLPINLHKGSTSQIEDEDFAQEIHLHLQSLESKYFLAADVQRFLALPETHKKFQLEKIPSLRTVCCWLYAMSYHYGKVKNRMYVDGHERADVIEYRQSVFLPLWLQLEARMTTWTSDNEVILVTHDESIFYAHDRRNTHWIHKSEKPEPVCKGEGVSIMVSDFCLPELGWLTLKDGTDKAQILFRVSKNRDGYFDSVALMAQTEKAINLFEDNFGDSAIAAFGFDNAPSHQKRAADALSARHMPKNTKLWTPMKEGIKMCDGFNPLTQQRQSFYFPDNHPIRPGYFKEMRLILEECGFENAGKLPAQCGKSFNCANTGPDVACCCHRILFNQKDFLEQKPALVELVENRSHIAFFYPKFHCEVNFIEQTWESAKAHYRIQPLTQNKAQMEQNIWESLDQVDIIKMRCFANQSARFLDAYQKGLNGAQAMWANRKYHGHRVLPEKIMEALDATNVN